MIKSFIVVLDACVLYPAPLRDLLIRLAQTNLFRARWTKHIHFEWMNNLLNKRPDLSREKLERTRELMDISIRDCLIEGYEELIPTVNLPDSNDNHVLAAAIHAQANIILTYNLQDFPNKFMHSYGIKAQHPDHFLSSLMEIEPDKILITIHHARMSLNNPPKDLFEYLDCLERQSLPNTVALLREKMSLPEKENSRMLEESF